MERNILPIKYDIAIKTECWTFNRLSIIATTTNYYDWIIDKFSIINFSFFGFFDFGYLGPYKPKEFYSDILLTEEVPTDSITNIVDFLIDEINHGKYIIINLEFSKIFENHSFHVHDQLIYGYDTIEKVFYTPFSSGNDIRETKISFDKFEEAYLVIKDDEIANQVTEFHNYPVTRLTKIEFSKSNSIESFYKHIDDNLHPKNIKPISLTEGYLSGIKVYKVYKNIARKNIVSMDLEDIKQYALFVKKIYECRQLLNEKLHWMFQSNLDQVTYIININNQIKKESQECYLTAIRYWYSKDKKNINLIIKQLNKIKKLDKKASKEILSQIRNNGR